MKTKLKHGLAVYLRPKGKQAFIRSLGKAPRVLDVGCGNAAVVAVKNVSPGCHYVGLDIGDYNQNEVSKSLMDRYILTSPERFADTIGELEQTFDGVISSHNLEHCDDRVATLDAMMNAVKEGGRLYLAFPTARSVTFPGRGGTLNYYDDPTHTGNPRRLMMLLSVFKKMDFGLILKLFSIVPLSCG